LDAWRQAGVIKADSGPAQLPVRIRALHKGKLRYMAVPRLAGLKPFYLLDPANVSLPFEDAATPPDLNLTKSAYRRRRARP
jgi:5-formyltetrahydrofolate cyclo-ligase